MPLCRQRTANRVALQPAIQLPKKGPVRLDRGPQQAKPVGRTGHDGGQDWSRVPLYRHCGPRGLSCIDLGNGRPMFGACQGGQLAAKKVFAMVPLLWHEASAVEQLPVADLLRADG
ncbi:hypothetical protein ACQY0O_005374 [Thecaphora frezii]